MENYSIYRDVARRTGGEIYIGVVGPVRCGKSTFIKRFMEKLVIPNIKNDFDRERAKDELPQSSAGRTVMTTEPKFIPDEAVEITVGENTRMLVRMIDCVGFMVPDALGSTEDGTPRMVHTPWSEESIPFEEAAETGTKKVIADHSTIGILMTTDGSFGELPRDSFEEAEAHAAEELNAIGKPYVIVVNSSHPKSDETAALAEELKEKYGAPAIAVNCLDLDKSDINEIMKDALYVFPIKEISVRFPDFLTALPKDHRIRRSVVETVKECAGKVRKTGEVEAVFGAAENENVKRIELESLDPGMGTACVSVKLCDGLLYKLIGEMSGINIENDGDLLRTLTELSLIKKKYVKVSRALAEVMEKGYGIVTPGEEDLTLEKPEIVKQNGGYGVKLRASAPSIHMIRADIKTEVSPTVGSEVQSEELARFMLKEFEENPERIWETNMLGKSLHELVNEGLLSKLSNIPDDARKRLSQTLQKVVNEGSGGMVCIIL